MMSSCRKHGLQTMCEPCLLFPSISFWHQHHKALGNKQSSQIKEDDLFYRQNPHEYVQNLIGIEVPNSVAHGERVRNHVVTSDNQWRKKHRTQIPLERPPR